MQSFKICFRKDIGEKKDHKGLPISLKDGGNVREYQMIEGICTHNNGSLVSFKNDYSTNLLSDLNESQTQHLHELCLKHSKQVKK